MVGRIPSAPANADHRLRRLHGLQLQAWTVKICWVLCFPATCRRCGPHLACEGVPCSCLTLLPCRVCVTHFTRQLSGPPQLSTTCQCDSLLEFAICTERIRPMNKVNGLLVEIREKTGQRSCSDLRESALTTPGRSTDTASQVKSL